MKIRGNAPARLRALLPFLLLLFLLLAGCAAKQQVPLDCVTEEVLVYVDGKLLAENPDVVELAVGEPHKIYFKRPGHEPELIVLETVVGPDGTKQLEPSDVCRELVPIGVDRELTIEPEEGAQLR